MPKPIKAMDVILELRANRISMSDDREYELTTFGVAGAMKETGHSDMPHHRLDSKTGSAMELRRRLARLSWYENASGRFMYMPPMRLRGYNPAVVNIRAIEQALDLPPLPVESLPRRRLSERKLCEQLGAVFKPATEAVGTELPAIERLMSSDERIQHNYPKLQSWSCKQYVGPLGLLSSHPTTAANARIVIDGNREAIPEQRLPDIDVARAMERDGVNLAPSGNGQTKNRHVQVRRLKASNAAGPHLPCWYRL